MHLHPATKLQSFGTSPNFEIKPKNVHVTVHLERKLQRPGVMAADPCSSSRRRLLITDEKTKIQFLVDTRSNVCAYPRRITHKPNSQLNYTLCAANETKIHIYGDIFLQLDFGLRQNFTWRFIIADVKMPILEVSF